MTTAPAPSINVILPTGTQVGPWPTGWTYAEPDDVWVYIETDGAAGPDLVLNVDFTLTSAYPQVNGGAVTLIPSALPAGGWTPGRHRLILRRWTGRRQSVALPDVEGHKPRATEQALDRQMRIAEELSDQMDLAIMVPPGTSPPTPEEKAAVAVAAVVAQEAAAQVFGKAEADGSNVGPSFAEGAQIQASGAAAVRRSLASKLDETLSLADHASLNDALAVAGDRGRVIYIPAGGNLHITEEVAGGVYTFIAEGPFTRTGLDVVPGGVLNQLSGTGLLYNAQYIGQWSNQDGTFPFEEAFMAEGESAPNVYRSLSSAIFAVSSPNGGNAAVFTSRSSDGGTIGSGYALASYVINDRTMAEHGSVHGMWAYHSISIRKPGAGTTFGLEPGVSNKGSIEIRHPYYSYADGLTCAAWLASGAEMPESNPISAFLAFVYNGAGAMTGLLVTEDALEDRGGGYGELMAVPQKTYISQYLASGTGAVGQTGFQLTMAVATYEKGSRITADDLGLQISSIDDNSNWLFLNRTDLVAGPASSPWLSASAEGVTTPALFARNTWRTVAVSNQPISLTGTTARTTLAVVAIPPLPDDAQVRITALWTYPNSPNLKQPRIYFDGQLVASTNLTTTQSYLMSRAINASSTTSQKAFQADSHGSLNAPLTATTVDTTATRNLTLEATLANAGETIVLESYLVEVLCA